VLFVPNTAAVIVVMSFSGETSQFVFIEQ
jgi:hypothetical protein